MKLSVVIATHNRADILKTCLERLAVQRGLKDEQKAPEFEVVIVDDGSTDGTEGLVAELQKNFKAPAWSSFTYLKQPASHQGVARNRGVEKAKGEIIVFINDDIFIQPDFLCHHQEAHASHSEENAVVLGFSTWDPALEINPYMRFLESSGWQFGYGFLKAGLITHPEPYKFFYTSNISLKRTFFELERFDENFRKYGWEDIELGYRLWKNHGMKMIYEPKAFAHHHHFMEDSDLPRRMRAVGASAVHFEKLQPEAKVIPRGMKRFILNIAISPLLRPFASLLGKNFYYKVRSWQEFFVGIRISN